MSDTIHTRHEDLNSVIERQRHEIRIYRLALNRIGHDAPKMNDESPREIAKQALRDGVKCRA